MGKAKSVQAKLGLLSGLKMADLAPQAPGVAEFSTGVCKSPFLASLQSHGGSDGVCTAGEIMGYSADKLAAAFGVSREDQDKFALRSHLNAQDATNKGLFKVGEKILLMVHVPFI